MSRFPWMLLALAFAIAYPLIPGLDETLRQPLGGSMQELVTTLFIYSILALGLHVILGNAGMFHMGIAAFFALGAYTAGIFMTKSPSYPFQWHYLVVLMMAGFIAAGIGVAMAAPTLRLRGDYFALVTLGFCEVVKFTLRNYSEITGGKAPLTPPKPELPGLPTTISSMELQLYFIALGVLTIVYILLSNLENSRLGRAWVALREDELAASCMGLNIAKLKLMAIFVGGFIAGVAGVLYATRYASTADPEFYDFGRSVSVLSCLILGGLGSRKGVILGVFVIIGFDLRFADTLDRQLKPILPTTSQFLSVSFWKMGLFGLCLILVMRWRPDGLLSANREGKAPAAPKGGAA